MRLLRRREVSQPLGHPPLLLLLTTRQGIICSGLGGGGTAVPPKAEPQPKQDAADNHGFEEEWEGEGEQEDDKIVALFMPSLQTIVIN